MYKVLVCDDEKDIVSAISIYLTSDGYEVIPARNGLEALDIVKHNDVHLVLMDIMMPVMDGIEAMVEIRKISNVPVILLTAKSEDTDKVLGLTVGADDYVTKPFSMKILLKKIGVILKREQEESGQIYDDGFLYIDFLRARATVKGQPCQVTPTEFRLLREFVSHRGQLLTYDVLLDRLWEGGSQLMDRHALTVNVGRLRGKIEDAEHKYISNVYGMGYQWIG